MEALHIQVVFDLNVCLDVLTGHTRPPPLAARAKAVEERLLRVVDPIDYNFLAPLLHTSRANECQASPAFSLGPKAKARGCQPSCPLHPKPQCQRVPGELCPVCLASRALALLALPRTPHTPNRTWGVGSPSLV